MIDEYHRAPHWRGTVRLTLIMLGVLGLILVLVPVFSVLSNELSFMGFPLGYYLAAQGAVIAMIALVFWAGASQEHWDRQHGASEDI